MSKYEKAERGGQDTPTEQARFRKMAGIISQFLSSTTLRVFEVGCANGQLLALLKNQGYINVSGMDPSPMCAKTAFLQYGIKVTNNSLLNADVDDGSVDFLILAGVLEHVRDIATAMQILRKMLADNGNIFISVPDASRYIEGMDAPFQEFSVEHINFFGPVSLENFMLVNGFKMVLSIQDMITSISDTTTPVIHGLFQKSQYSNDTPLMVDLKTEESLKLYINQSIRDDWQIQETIEKIVSTNQAIIVWGTGAHTLRLLATSVLGTANIRAFVDSNPRYQGKQLVNAPVISPQMLNTYSEPILISSRAYQGEIVRQIQDELHLKNKIVTLYENQ